MHPVCFEKMNNKSKKALRIISGNTVFSFSGAALLDKEMIIGNVADAYDTFTDLIADFEEGYSIRLITEEEKYLKITT